MTGLVLKLQPHEKVLINGAVIQNGARSARIRVRSEGVSILRSKDALHPEDANTPVRRLYFAAQQALVGDADQDQVKREILAGVEELENVFGGEAASILEKAASAANDGRFYAVIRSLKKLFPVEDALLAHGAS